jgi:hypothetical protein
MGTKINGEKAGATLLNILYWIHTVHFLLSGGFQEDKSEKGISVHGIGELGIQKFQVFKKSNQSRFG